MDHELEQWVNDTKDPKWPCGRHGVSLVPVAIGSWAKPDVALRRKILGPKKPKGLSDLQKYFNSNFHS